jgi:hypothetical protein
LVTLQQDVANLRNLFGTELARQAAKVAKSTAGTGKSSGGGGTGKMGKKRAQQRARTILSAKSGEQQAEFLEMPQKGVDSSSGQQPLIQPPEVSQTSSTPTPKKGKKKKRSTMANASNPHHLRNYVPSRLPHAAGGGGSTGNHGHGNQAGNVNNSLWPLALKFLSADLTPGRRKETREQNGNINVQSLVVPQEEWICLFCEYSLFYGEEMEYRRAVRNRKKVLKRRRRARERAAAAASGVSAVMKNGGEVVAGGEGTEVDEEGEEYDGYDESVVPATRVERTGRDREPPG